MLFHLQLHSMGHKSGFLSSLALIKFVEYSSQALSKCAFFLSLEVLVTISASAEEMLVQLHLLLLIWHSLDQDYATKKQENFKS